MQKTYIEDSTVQSTVCKGTFFLTNSKLIRIFVG